MISNKPYLIRALYEWIGDSGLTPYILVNAKFPDCHVPESYVKEGRIVLNIVFNAVKDLLLGNEAIEFTARFSGVPMLVYIPIGAVLAIYAKENGEGMAFPEETPAVDEKRIIKKGKPNLKIVK